MTEMAMLVAILLILMLSPLGYVPIGVLRITTMHIPVLIGAIVLGKKAGAFLGIIFGLTSMIINTINPTITSFIFSPFISVGDMNGNFYSVLIAIVPRVLLGFNCGYLYEKLKERTNDTMCIVIAASIGTLTNTLLVLGGIYLFFGAAYASARGIAYNTLIQVLLTTIFTNGILEVAIGIIATLAISKMIKRR